MKKVCTILSIMLVFLLNTSIPIKADIINYTIKLGQSTTIYCGMHYDDGTKTWTSSNPAVVKITAPNGNYCGIYAAALGKSQISCDIEYTTYETRWIPNGLGGGFWGTVTVTAHETYVYSITVTETGDLNNIASVKVGFDNETLYIGDSMKFDIQLRNKNNKLVYDFSKLNWFSSDNSVATVDKYGVVHALTSGTVTITAQTADGTKDSSTITVTDFKQLIPISTKEELNAIRNNTSGRYYLTNDIIFTSNDFEAGGAFYNNGAGWIPIDSFTGYLNGNHYSIQNLTVKSATNSGLFNEIQYGTITNLEMINANINASNHAGTIAATVYWTIIENCKGSNSSINGYYSGGIVGFSGSSKINNSTNDSLVNGKYCAGGIVGDLSFSDVYFCKNTGTVNGNNVYAVGGIAGLSGVSNVFFTSNVGTINLNCKDNLGGDGYGQYFVGGIGGYIADTRVNNSFNIGKICINSNNTASSKNYVAGGVTGCILDRSLVEDCYNSADIDVNCLAGNPVLGGIGNINIQSIDVDDDGLRIYHCYNSGNINVLNSLTHKKGGIIGTAIGTNAAYSRTVVNECYYLNTSNDLKAAAQLYIGTIRNTQAVTNSQLGEDSSLPYLDFNTIWEINKSSEYKYPILISAKIPVNYYTCVVTFNTLSGNDVEHQVVKNNGLVQKPTDPTLIGNSFGGWYKDIKYTLLWDFDKDIVMSDTTLYAKWIDAYDFNKDGTVSVLDIAIAANNYNLKNTDVKWNSDFDINKDGIVDIYDLVQISKKI